MRLYNTATRAIEDFAPLKAPGVSMYTCGPTVYNYAHIGNLRAYVFADILRRTLELNNYTVTQIVNITDVGHLVSDGDEGEDKIEVGAKREGKSVEEIIAMYSDAFYADLDALNIEKASLYPRATKYIAEQKALTETLRAEGYTYTTSDGIYFDTSKFPRYADFARLDIAGMHAGARVEMGEKKNPTDFALWKFSPSDGVRREQEWPSPLEEKRMGFPGWHIECSAIAMHELGETIDIHTGGVDHIPVHHTNEIAQSESATGEQFVRYWLHSAHMMVDGAKMSKSLGNTYTLADLETKGISPLAYRYWLLTAHYRTQVNFTWDAVTGAQTALKRIRDTVALLAETLSPELTQIHLDTLKGEADQTYCDQLIERLNNDIDTPGAIALLNKLSGDTQLPPQIKLGTLVRFNEILQLGLFDALFDELYLEIPEGVQKLMDEREEARNAKNWPESDRLRDVIREFGFEVKDTPNGQKLERV